MQAGESHSWRASRQVRTIVAAAITVSALVIPQAAHAEITGFTGQVVAVAPLPDVRPGASEDANLIRLFRESSEEVLSAPLPVDANVPGLYDQASDLPLPQPFIPAGTSVDSYLLHADVPGEPVSGPSLHATIGFDRDILGVEMNATTLDTSDAVVGAPGTAYPNLLWPKRGLEWDNNYDAVDWIDSRTIVVSFNINTVVDDVRIITAAAAAPPGQPAPPPLPPEIATGYRFVASDGGVFSFGNRNFYGSTGAMTLNQPIVVGSETSTGRGYWLIARDGGVFNFGDATFEGSTGGMKLSQPIVAMAPTQDDRGYWLFAADGGVFNFGDASFRGSTGNRSLNKPIVAAAATPDGGGYWMAASDGGIFNFGDAGFYGSTGAMKLNQPIVAMAPTASGKGYWLVARDGGIFTYGDAGFFGSTGAMTLNQPIVALQPTPSGQGYWLVAADGGVFSFGDAKFLGSTGGIHLTKPIVGVL